MNPNEILAALELKFAGRRKDGLEQLAQVLAIQFDTIEDGCDLLKKKTLEEIFDIRERPLTYQRQL